MSHRIVESSLKLLCLACLAIACSSIAFAANKLTAVEIRKLLTGTYHISLADSVSAVAVFTPAGSIAVTTNKGEKDTGRWSLSGNKMCVQFKSLLDHKINCSSLTDEDGAIRGSGFTARRK